VLARSATLRRGTHRFRLEPSRRGDLRVDVAARDLAGNAGRAARTLAISGRS
jgi:hypothetical protein